MKLGIGMHPEHWSDDHLALARQLGCETVVAWVPFGPGDGYWHLDQFKALRAQVERHGLGLAAVENFHWEHIDHIVLGEPGRDEQLENLCKTIRHAGEAGIPCIGYNFSVAGVRGYFSEPVKDGRGLAALRMFDEEKVDHTPLPNQHFWFKDPIARRSPEGTIPPVGEEEYWGRIKYFLEAVIPTAEKYGVKLCAHPEDPPIPFLKGYYRAFHSVEGLRKLLALVPSESNCLEFCQGTVSTMKGVDIYAAIAEFAATGRIGYVHFRNTSGQRPRYQEVFIDNGYIDMRRAINLYRQNGFDGTIIPDHAPTVSAVAPRETAFAYALGYMRALLQYPQEESKKEKVREKSETVRNSAILFPSSFFLNITVDRLKTLWILFKEMFLISAFVLGGGFAILAVTDERFARKYGWTKEGEVIGSLPVFQMVPGMICTNTAIYVGNKVAGALGAAVALVGTVLPSLIIFSAVTAGYDLIPLGNPYLAAAFSGLRASLAGIIAALIVRGWTKSVQGVYGYGAVVAATALIVAFGVPAAPVILTAAVSGVALEAGRRAWAHKTETKRFGSAFWMLPLVFLKYGALAFGGGYVLVPLYMADFVGPSAPFLQLSADEFANVMALTQMTPGSISVNCATFFGWRLAGVAGAVVATFAMVVPAYVLLLLLLRSLDRFRTSAVVQGLLAGIKPVTVAMMLSAVWAFAGMSAWTVSETGVAFHPVEALLALGTAVALNRRWLSVIRLIFLCAILSVFCCLVF